MRMHGREIVKWDGARNKAELYTLLTNTIMIRRLKKDVLTQLPAKRRQRIFLNASKLDSSKMAELQEALSQKESVEEEGISSGGPEIMECFRITAEAKIDGVTEYVDYLLSNDLKFLIFAHHHVMLDAIEKKVNGGGVNYIRIDGKTPAQARQPAVARFQEDTSVRVAILGITAAGAGFTLTAAHTVVFAELYWVPGQMMQAEDRVHRIGQQEMVDVHYCIAQGSLDEVLFKALNRKSKDTTAILDGQSRDLNIHKHANAGIAPASSPKRQAPGASSSASPKKRGRPKKENSTDGGKAGAEQHGLTDGPKKRGRPKKENSTDGSKAAPSST